METRLKRNQNWIIRKLRKIYFCLKHKPRGGNIYLLDFHNLPIMQKNIDFLKTKTDPNDYKKVYMKINYNV